MNKIAIYIPNDFPNGEKNNARLKAIGENLTNHEWDITYISLMPTRFAENEKEPQPKSWQKQPVKHILNWSTYPSSFGIRVFQIIACQFAFLLFILRHGRSFDVSYFYTPQWIGTMLGLLLCKAMGLVTVVDQTDLHSTFRNRFMHKTEERLVSNVPTLLLAISSFLSFHFKGLKGKAPIEEFSILVNMERFVVSYQSQKYLLGYIGSFAEKDGIEMLLHAISIAKESIPEIKVRLIGNDPFLEKTKEWISTLELDSNIDLVGSVSYDEIPKLLKECDSLIMNRVSTKFAETGYPIKLGEYFACNRPVLMSNGPGFSEDYTHLKEAIKYEVDDAQSLADAIIWRYENPMIANKIAQNGYKFAKENFDAEKNVKWLSNKLIELCEK